VSAPLPPADLESRDPEIVTLAERVVVERFFTAAFSPIYFDRSLGGRLNAPDGSYGVIYAAEQLRGAFAETFLREPGRTLLSLDLIRQKGRARLVEVESLKMDIDQDWFWEVAVQYGVGLAP
jgi:hypothetical protein